MRNLPGCSWQEAKGYCCLLVMLAATLAGCGGASHSGSATTSPGGGPFRTDPADTVWLCRPGLADDPCTARLATTSVPATGPRTVATPIPATDPAFDCFYVYPTVSTQPTDNADLQVQPAEIDAAIAQASPLSPLCRVWAPMYRQRTEASLLKGLGNDPAADQIAYDSVLAAWNDYLTHFNDGRPVIFIGHSQGAAMLIRLLSSQVDPNPKLRAQTVSAVLAGGNVTVPTGGSVGSTFSHLPLCTSASETSCVIAYSTFPGEPPADSEFGRPGQGVSLQSGQTATAGLQVACVNPADLDRRATAADLSPLFPTSTMPPPRPSVATPWVTYPDLYTASCQRAGGATWLQVTATAGPGDHRPLVSETLGPAWGYHLEDINLALGNLVDDLRLQEQAYTAHHG